MFAQEQGVGRGAEPATSVLDIAGYGAGGNYATAYGYIPYFLTSRNRGLYLTNDSFSYTTFDFSCNYSASKPPSFGDVLQPVQAKDECNFTQQSNSTVNRQGCKRGRIQVLRPMMRGQLLSGANPLDIIQQYSEYTGRMQDLPRWFSEKGILGLQGGTQEVLDSVERLKQYVQSHFVNLTVSDVLGGVWLQDWTGQRNFSGNGQLPRVGLWWNWEVSALSGLVSHPKDSVYVDDACLLTWICRWTINIIRTGVI